MKRLTGVSASKGISIGQLCFYDNHARMVQQSCSNYPDKEWERFDHARRRAIEMLKALYDQATDQVGQDQSMIFSIHQLMLNDEDYIRMMQELIWEKHYTAEYAVQQAGLELSEMFYSMHDDYLRERGADMQDISKRILHVLCGEEMPSPSNIGSQCIIAADDLMPSETIQLDQNWILGFVTCRGSNVSHTAILARSLGIPAIVGLGKSQYQQLRGKSIMIIDGFEGLVIADPDERTLNEYRKKSRTYFLYRERLKSLRGVPSRTKDGICLQISAGISSVKDIPLVLENDADAIGLLRTETLYIENDGNPGEQVQFEAYVSALEQMNGKAVVVRTLDIDNYHSLPSLKLSYETNPAMGCRGIRIALRRPQFFSTQLRALLRASAHGPLGILLPLITSVEEVRTAKAILNDCKSELDSRRIAYNKDISLGILVETPAAVMIADDLAKEAEFFLIGVNDLTQYTLAVDRTNGSIGSMHDPSHPAVVRLIEIAIEAAARAKIPCYVSGDASAVNPALVRRFLGLGVSGFCVSPPEVLEVRELVRKIDFTKETVPEGHASQGLLI